MSKPIVNGIDVSECAYFNSVTYEEPYCNIDQEHLYTCSSDENCYFKQLKRLQEENEELKKRCEEWALETVKMQGTIDGKDFKIDKYRQALEEIRAFINPTYFDCKNCKELKKPFTQQNCNGFRYETILNRIDEVLNDRD